MNETTILLLILPIVILELALIVFALRDLLRPERRVRGDSKLMWGIIIVLFQHASGRSSTSWSVARRNDRVGLTGRGASSRALASPVAVTCRGLTKRFGGADGVLAVDGLDLDVPAGSVFGLLGPNGAGKTTTLRLLTGLARPTGGTVTIDDRPVTADGAATARRSASSTRTRATTAG